MLERLSFRHLRTLRHLHRTRSMRETAAIVHRSQPAISLQIKDLEEIVGFRIIVHQRGSIIFTIQGEKFASMAAALEEQMQSSLNELKSNLEPSVKVGITQDLYAACGHLLKKFRDHGVKLLPMNSLAILQACSDNALNLGIAKTGTPMQSAEKTWSQQLSWASRNPYLRPDKDLELVLLAEGCHYHQLALRTFEHSEPDDVSLCICDGWSDIATNLATNGVTIVPSSWRRTLGEWPTTTAFPELPTTSLNLVIADSKSSTVDWVARQLSTVVNSALEGGDSSGHHTWVDRGVKLFH